MVRKVLGLVAIVGAAVAVACSGTGGGSTGGSGGSGAVGGTAGGATGGTGGGTGATGGAGGFGATGGSGVGGTIALDSGTDAPDDATLTDGPGVVNDAALDVEAGCLEGGTGYQPGPRARRCAAAVNDECAGGADIDSRFPNGSTGNGFDDDCDGRVDEGCGCPGGVAAGETKECWLVPASQADDGGAAVGWCTSNSRGSMACTTVGSGEFAQNEWDGECRGAQPPFASDVCANGDYDCDGLVGNSRDSDCSCDEPVVECPTQPIVTAPYPNPTALPVLIDGATWITSGNAAQATNWRWTATGGDCDNILPHPSFQVFVNPNTTVAPFFVGTQATGLGPGGNQVGLVVQGANAGPRLYPAFALSGDYLVKGEWDLAGRHYECTVRVQVRAPGIRAELCWAPMGTTDVDLHFARLQGANCTGGGAHGWFQTCRSDNAADDCYYNSASGCPPGGGGANWGYTASPNSACQGWGSRRGTALCQNPRLDTDNVSCAVAQRDPNFRGFLPPLGFCAAENINLDNPRDGDRFAIGAHAYSFTGTVRPHINVYCNGERRLSLGYDPVNGNNFPALTVSGADTGGDFWSAAVVRAVVSGGQLSDCVIEPVDSAVFKPTKDGSTNYCVDTNPRNASTGSDWRFRADGQYPPDAEICWH